MTRLTLFVDVILPLPLQAVYTYRVPFDLNEHIQIGHRVIVQFGPHKIYTGIVQHIHQTSPPATSIKYILSILDEKAIILPTQFKLWEWISTYYMCNLGDVMNAAIPSALKLTSETTILLNEIDSEDKTYSINEKENRIINFLDSAKDTSISELVKFTGLSDIIPTLQTLIEKKIITLSEEVTEKYKPKTETIIKLHTDFQDEPSLRILFDSFNSKAVKQLNLLMSYVELSRILTPLPQEVTKKDLLEKSNSSEAQLRELIKKAIFVSEKKAISRIPIYKQNEGNTINFAPQQETAYTEINNQFENKHVVLLHGITSSGKTEIYIKLIEDTIAQGKQVLYLLPEIALTTQIISRIKKYFGNKIAVYHSRCNSNERVEVWKSLLHDENKISIILGARSAIFLPYSNLGLIIVDEEHDPSYKQTEPAPRYNARDSAIYLASVHNSKVLLGSATPALESYYNAMQGKYGFVELNKRYSGISMPEIVVVDIKKELKNKNMHMHYSQRLLDQMKNALINKDQVILFQNRRGHSLYLECQSCQCVPECKNCDVSLTYHKQTHQLICHYCGYTTKVYNKCPQCNSNEIKMKGFGTEKIEEDMPLFFNNINVARMDLDTTRNKNSLEKIIYNFENKKIDILIGTQMITKGLDFDHVSLVGILNADNMLSFPDFRSYERCFQLLTQVSGRAGRKHNVGRVIIQTRNPDNPIIKFVEANDYKGFYTSQIQERSKYNYPPFFRLILIKIKHKEDNSVLKASNELAIQFKKIFNQNTLGPQWAIVPRVQNYYIKQILIKLPNDASIVMNKQMILETITSFKKQSEIKSLRISVDVDPQ